MNEVFLIIGGNLGKREVNLAKARSYIEGHIGAIVKYSSIYNTEPWGIKQQPEFLNQVLLVATNLSAAEVLVKNLEIEKLMGRVRKEKYGARIMDIDILYYNDLILNSKNLTIPHPEIPNRRFVLEPLAEIAPEHMHPLLKKTSEELLKVCADGSIVKKY